MTKEHLGYLITRTSGQVVSESLLPVFPPPTSSLPHSSSHSSTPPPALCVCVSDVRSEVKSTEALMGHEDPLTRQCRGRWFRRYYEAVMHLEELSIVIGCCKEAACFTAACKHHEQEGMWGDDTVKRKIVLLAVDYWKVLTTKQGKPELPHKFTILDGHVIGGKLFLSTGMAHLTMG